MTFSSTAVTISACNSAGRNCGSKTISATLLNYSAGTAVAVSGTPPGNLKVAISPQGGGIFSINIAAVNNTRTTNSVTFTAGSCGTQKVNITTK